MVYRVFNRMRVRVSVRVSEWMSDMKLYEVNLPHLSG